MSCCTRLLVICAAIFVAIVIIDGESYIGAKFDIAKAILEYLYSPRKKTQRFNLYTIYKKENIYIYCTTYFSIQYLCTKWHSFWIISCIGISTVLIFSFASIWFWIFVLAIEKAFYWFIKQKKEKENNMQLNKL